VKDLYAVLLEKEQEVKRLRKEVEALRNVLPLLAEDSTEPLRPEPSSNNKWPIEVTGAR
jgi:hypothetical protein